MRRCLQSSSVVTAFLLGASSVWILLTTKKDAACAVVTVVEAFQVVAVNRPSSFSSSSFFSPSSLAALSEGDDDDGSDWYSDYDPSQFGGSDSGASSTRSRYDGGGGDNSGGGYGGGRGGYGGDNGGGYGGGRGRRTGGGGGGDVEYRRDTSRDNSNVDVAAVERMIAERNQARKRRDFDAADSIRDDLLSDFGVAVFDKDRAWRTGCSASGSGMRVGNYQKKGWGGQKQQQRGRPSRNFGPNGHDYELSRDAGEHTSSLSTQEVHEMLARRLQAKLERQFETADGIEYELADAGVYVHDGMKEWRGDGVQYGDYGGRSAKPGRTRDSWSDRSRPYRKSEYSLPLDDEDAESDEIDQLVNERARCKMTREYDEADRIRDGLKEKFGVEIDDKIREWSVGGNFGTLFRTQRVAKELHEGCPTVYFVLTSSRILILFLI